MRNFIDIVNDYSENESIELYDHFDFELDEDLLIESNVIGLTDDAIVISGDDTLISLLEGKGFICSPGEVSGIKCEPSDASLPSVTKESLSEESPEPLPDEDVDYEVIKQSYEQLAKLLYKTMPNRDEARDLAREILGLDNQDLEEGLASSLVKLFKTGSKVDQTAPKPVKQVDTDFTDLAGRPVNPPRPQYDPDDIVMTRPDGSKRVIKGVDESGLQAYLGKKKYGKEGMKALQKAGREGASEEEKGKIKDRLLGKKKTNEAEVDEAKYQGREVPLGKPMAGDVKKSKVYVRKPNGKIVKVNFGDKKMRIKKSNPSRRKSFRARHNCKNPGPRWKARYWSCRAW